MKYKTWKEVIIEDEGLFDGITNLHELSRATGIHVTYLCRVRNGTRIVGEKLYNKMKEKIGEFKKNNSVDRHE